jgi:hypothetical protein
MNGGGGLGLGGGVLVTGLLLALVVLRFLARELRDRRIPLRRFYALPGVFAVLAALLVALDAASAPWLLPELLAGTPAGIAVGFAIGLAVDRFTSLRLDPGGTVAIVRGSWVTAGIWVAALLLRLLGRYVAWSAGLRSVGVSLTLNAVLVVMLASAVLTLRLRLFSRAKAPRDSSPGAVAL